MLSKDFRFPQFTVLITAQNREILAQTQKLVSTLIMQYKFTLNKPIKEKRVGYITAKAQSKIRKNDFENRTGFYLFVYS